MLEIHFVLHVQEQETKRRKTISYKDEKIFFKIELHTCTLGCDFIVRNKNNCDYDIQKATFCTIEIATIG